MGRGSARGRPRKRRGGGWDRASGKRRGGGRDGVWAGVARVGSPCGGMGPGFAPGAGARTQSRTAVSAGARSCSQLEAKQFVTMRVRAVYDHEDLDGDVTAEVYQPTPQGAELLQKRCCSLQPRRATPPSVRALATPHRPPPPAYRRCRPAARPALPLPRPTPCPPPPATRPHPPPPARHASTASTPPARSPELKGEWEVEGESAQSVEAIYLLSRVHDLKQPYTSPLNVAFPPANRGPQLRKLHLRSYLTKAHEAGAPFAETAADFQFLLHAASLLPEDVSLALCKAVAAGRGGSTAALLRAEGLLREYAGMPPPEQKKKKR